MESDTFQSFPVQSELTENKGNADLSSLTDLKMLFEAIPDGIVKVDQTGTIIACNTCARTLFTRITPHDPQHILRLEKLRAVLVRDAFGHVLNEETSPVARLLRGEQLSGLQAPVLRFPTRDGRELYLQISGSSFCDAKGVVQAAILVLRDVTESTQRKRYLEEMVLQGVIEQRRTREREERARHISALTSDYAYAYQLLPDGTIKREWNTEAFTRITGYQPEELDALGWENASIYLEEEQALRTARLAAMQAGVPDVQEWRIVTKSGDVRWFRDSCHPVKNEVDGVIHVYGAAHDITEQKKAEEQVYQLSLRLSTVFEAIADGILICDCDGHVLQMNAAAIQQGAWHLRPDAQGLSLSEQLDLLQLRSEDNYPLPFKQSPHYRVLQGETLKGPTAIDILVTALDGRELYLNVSGAPIHDKDGEQIGAVLIAHDVTAIHKHEQRTQRALAALLKMAETLVHFPEQAERSAVVADEAAYTVRQDVTKHLLALTCELLGVHTAGIMTIDALNERFVPIAMLGGECNDQDLFWSAIPNLRLSDYFMEEQQTLLAAGEVVLLDMDQLPLVDSDTYGFQHILAAPLYIREQFLGLICVDYTDSEQAYPLHEAMTLFKVIGKLTALVIERERLIHEKIVAQAKALAEAEANRQKDEFLRMASQELRNPLATIKASLQLTRLRLQQLNGVAPSMTIVQQIEEMLNRGERQVAVESRLVGDLLDVSRVQEHTLELQTKLCNVYDVVRNVVADIQTGNTLRPIKISKPAIDMFPVVADVERLGQVLTNYIHNAMKYSPIDKPIEIFLDVDEAHVCVRICDQGPGIALEEQQRIWERFYQVPNRVVYSGSSGLGLGLHICQMIITQHNGFVGVESQLNQGASFWFKLPVALV